MKEGYIPKDKRKKIMMLSDDIRTHSGVGNMAKGNLKLTSVKLVDHLFEDFKVSSIRYKFNLQKLANRAVHLYLTDEEFRKKLHNHTDLTISGSL